MLLSPNQIHKALAEDSRKLPEGSLSQQLALHGLSPTEILEHVSSEMRCAEQPATRLRAAELGLKLNGLLQGDERPDFVVNIVINDSEFSGQNPILFPR